MLVHGQNWQWGWLAIHLAAAWKWFAFLTWQALGYTASSLLVFCIVVNLCRQAQMFFCNVSQIWANSEQWVFSWPIWYVNHESWWMYILFLSYMLYDMCILYIVYNWRIHKLLHKYTLLYTLVAFFFIFSPRSMAVQAWLPAWRTCWLHVRRADLTNERVLEKVPTAKEIFHNFCLDMLLEWIKKESAQNLMGLQMFTVLRSGNVAVCQSHPYVSSKGERARPSDPHLWCETKITQFDFAKGIITTAIEQDKPVIRKALVEMTGDLHGSWVMENHFWSHSMFGSLRHFWGHNRSSSSRRSGTICEFVTCAP